MICCSESTVYPEQVKKDERRGEVESGTGYVDLAIQAGISGPSCPRTTTARGTEWRGGGRRAG